MRFPHKGESPASLRGAVYALYHFSRSSCFYLHSFYLCLLQYAQETQHEKILRGLAVGIAFTMYGRLEEADPLVTSLCADKDPILRRSGMYTLAMAYCGTGNNQAIRKLLHVAVSDSKRPSRRLVTSLIRSIYLLLLFHAIYITAASRSLPLRGALHLVMLLFADGHCCSKWFQGGERTHLLLIVS
jgi:hypothetical protein